MTKRHSTILAAVAIAAALTTALDAQQGQADVALRAAMEMETVRGDFRGAIEAYKKVFETYRSNRPVAAQALFQLADLQHRMGNAEARATYAQIVKDYHDQASLLMVAQARLATFVGGQTTGQVTERLVFTPPTRISLTSISSDGRFALLNDDSETGGLGVRDMSTGQVKWIPGTNTTRNSEIDFEILSPDLSLLAYMFDEDDDVSLKVVRNDVAAIPRTLLSGNGEFDNVQPGAWSIDGRSILAGLQRSDKTWQIAWVSVADGAVRVVKSLGWRALDGRPRLSPDGRHIAYAALSTSPSGPEPRLTQSIDSHVFVMATDGSQEVTPVASPGNHWNPVWAPDGGHILFESDRAGRRQLWAVPVRDGVQAGADSLVRDNLGGAFIGLTRDGSYFFSVGSRLDVISIVQFSADRTIPPAPTSGAFDLFGTAPAWSPEGKSIAVLRGAGIAIRSLETGIERFHASPGLAGPLVWFHDGTRVAVNVRRPGGLAWEAVDVGTGRFKELLPADPSELRSGGALSIDDKTLFYWARSGDGGTLDRIVAVDLATGAKRDVHAIPPPRGSVAFALSPDGQSLAIRSYDPTLRQAQIDLVGTDGSGYRELYKPSQGPAALSGVKWTRDGIFFAEDVGAERLVIMRLAADSGNPQRVGALGGAFAGFAINPDATRVAYSTVIMTREVRALDNLLAVLKTPK